MTSRNALRWLLTSSAVAALAGFYPMAASAQDAQEGTQPQVQGEARVDQDTDTVEEVVVTGSRIRRPDLTSSSPIATVTQEDLQVVGANNVEEYLNTLPQLIAGATKSTNVAGSADATATLNLRGLGAKRTLVLVNGRRFPASTQEGIVDVNNIPASLVERVEVVTGGASAVYGSDAMAGVVNFILRERFDGLMVDGQYGISGQGDAQTWNTSLTVGSSGEKAHAWLHVSLEDRETLRGTERKMTETSLIDANGVFVPSGSAGRLGGTLIGIQTPNGSGGFVNRDYALDNMIPRPFVNSDFNFAARGDYAIQIPLERVNIFGRGAYEFTPNLKAFTEITYTNADSRAILSPTAPNIRATQNVPGLPANASFITPQIRALLNARPNPNAPFALRFLAPEPFPKREIAFNRDLYKVLGGFQGEFLDNWDWEATYSYSHLATTEVQKGDISRRTFVEASTPSPTDPTKCANGNPRCVLVTNLTNWSPALVDYLLVDNISSTEITEKIAAAQITGDLFDLPAGALSVAAGAEYREVSSADNPAPVLLDFASAGFGERNRTSGSFDVSEIYGEALVPLIANMPGVDYLGLEVAARLSNYSGAGEIWTYKAGGEWRVNEDIRFRSLYQRAVRAPNINELFGGLINQYPFIVDPCSRSANPTGAVAALCVAQGVPASAIGTYQQNGAALEARFVSNPDLDPERSDTLTVGAVWTPRFIPRLSVTLDYYQIEISDAIERLGGGPQGVLSGCFASLDRNNPFCQTFSRSPTTFEIVDFRVPLANVANLKTSGVDMAAAYNWTMDRWGIGADDADFRFNLLTTWVDENIFQANGTARPVDRAGTVGGDVPAIPEWRANATLAYASAGFEFTWNTEYLSSVKDRKYANNLAAGVQNPTAGIANPEVDAYWYHNIRAAYEFDRYTIYGGVRNLFDKEPPLLSSPIESNTDPNTYDIIGRYFFAGLSARF